jgi:hypothetical protein
MKRMLSVVMALALLGGSTTAALAHGRPHDGYRPAQPYGSGYGYGYRDGYRRDNGAAALGFGLLAFGLIATLAAQNNHRDYYGPGYGYSAQPYGYGGGYGGGYNGGYGGGYGPYGY